MKKLFSVIFMNFFGFDMIIFLVAVATALVFYFTKKSADVLYNKLHLNIFVPDSGASRRQADSDISGIRETDIVSMRNRTGSLYSLFVNLTGIFPLLGILGTVISLLGAERSGAHFKCLSAECSTAGRRCCTEYPKIARMLVFCLRSVYNKHRICLRRAGERQTEQMALFGALFFVLRSSFRARREHYEPDQIHPLVGSGHYQQPGDPV